MLACLPALAPLYGNLAYLLSGWVDPLITALTGALVFVIGRGLGLTPAWAVAAALAYRPASPAVAQPLAALALTVAVWGLMEARDGERRRFVAVVGGSAR